MNSISMYFTSHSRNYSFRFEFTMLTLFDFESFYLLIYIYLSSGDISSHTQSVRILNDAAVVRWSRQIIFDKRFDHVVIDSLSI